MQDRPRYEMIDYAWFRLAGHLPGIPRPFYVGRGLAYDARCDSRTNKQTDPMPGHVVVKISLSPGGLACGGAGQRPARLPVGGAILREVYDHDAWDAYDPRHKGKPWEYVGLIFAGRSALMASRAIARRHGRVFRFDVEGSLVKRLLSLAREPTHTIRTTASGGMQLVQEVLLHLVADAETSGAAAAKPRLAASVEQVISGRLDRNFSVGELAEMHDVSREHLTRAFAHEYGVPPAQYAQQVKVREACRRLRQSGDAVKQIMRDVGFSSRASFARAFRATTGTTPLAYRRDRGAGEPLV